MALLAPVSEAGELLGKDFRHVGNVGPGPTILHGYTIYPNTLKLDGEAVKVTAFGFTKGDAGKCLRLDLEGNRDVSWCVRTQAAWLWEIEITRVSLTRVHVVAKLTNGEMLENTGVYGTGVQIDLPGGKTWEEPVTFKFLGESADPNHNDAVSMNYTRVLIEAAAAVR